MNLQGYANHRKARGLRGTTHVAVLYAINHGRLTAPAVQKVGTRWVIDPELADQQWAENTDVEKARGAPLPEAPPGQVPLQTQAEAHQTTRPGVPSLNSSKAIKAAAEAQMAQLDLQERKGTLVRKEDVQRDAIRCSTEFRDGLLALADRLAPVVAVEPDLLACRELLLKEFRSFLEKLSDGRSRS